MHPPVERLRVSIFEIPCFNGRGSWNRSNLLAKSDSGPPQACRTGQLSSYPGRLAPRMMLTVRMNLATVLIDVKSCSSKSAVGMAVVVMVQ